MHKILVLEQRREPEYSLFTNLGLELGLQVVSLDPGAVRMAGCRPVVDLEPLPSDYAGVVVRSYRRFAVVRQIAQAFRAVGKPVLGLDPLRASFSQDKLCDLMDLQAAAVPVPLTWARPEDAPRTVVVVKENWGYGGSGVQLLDMANVPLRNAPPLAWVNHHFQEYLEATEDWRVLVCEGKALPWVIRRRPAVGEFRTNTHQGGALEVVPVADFPNGLALSNIAEHAAAVLGRPCAGVDLRQGADGEPVVLEVNRTPRLRLGALTEKVVNRYLTAWARAL